MPLNPEALREAKIEGDLLYENLAMSWGHLTNANNGGPVTTDNLTIGTRRANGHLQAVEETIRRICANLARWGVIADYKARYVDDLVFWGGNLRREINSAIHASKTDRQRTPPVVLDEIRETFNFVRDPCHLECYPAFPPYRKQR